MNLWGKPSGGDLNWSRHGNRTGDHVYERTWSNNMRENWENQMSTGMAKICEGRLDGRNEKWQTSETSTD